MLFRSHVRADSIHRSLVAEQDYDLAIKRTSATETVSAQAMIKQGILLHRLRKGNVRPPSYPACAFMDSPNLRHDLNVGFMQYKDDAQQLWQQALTACTPLTDVSLVVQAHKLLNTPGAIAAALGADGPQQSTSPSVVLPNGTATVCKCSF